MNDALYDKYVHGFGVLFRYGGGGWGRGWEVVGDGGVYFTILNRFVTSHYPFYLDLQSYDSSNVIPTTMDIGIDKLSMW